MMFFIGFFFLDLFVRFGGYVFTPSKREKSAELQKKCDPEKKTGPDLDSSPLRDCLRFGNNDRVVSLLGTTEKG